QAAARGNGAQAGAAVRTGAPQGAGVQGSAQSSGRRFAAIAVQAVTVVSGPLITGNDTAGTVVPVTQSQVAAQVSGVVAKILKKVGDYVKEGAIVVQLDAAALQLALQNAQAALDNAKINLATGQQTTSGSRQKLTDQLQSAQNALNAAQKNYDSLEAQFDLGGVSSSSLDNATSQFYQAKANVESAKLALDQNQQADTQNIAQLKLAVDQATNQLALAQLNLQNAAVRAPFEGQIAAVNVTPGMYVSLNTSTFLLVSADKQINFTEPPTDAPNFGIGDVVQFNYAGRSYPVRLTQTPSAPINGVVPMVAAVPASLPVSYGTVGTITNKLAIGAGPQIPLAALQSRANTNFVYTVTNGKAAETPVDILAEAGTTAVVRGVEAGMQVIINPPPGLLSGSTVQVVAPATSQGQRTGSQQGQQSGGAARPAVGGTP
ncbi:MAG: biotin/lipoyl-binding protein, partial [Spirochaetes bacterium]|nr:biotin/lipoyl-binding protein [Spirochaetota bacterium]